MMMFVESCLFPYVQRVQKTGPQCFIRNLRKFKHIFKILTKHSDNSDTPFY